MNILDYTSFGVAKENDYTFIYDIECSVFKQIHSIKTFYEDLIKMNNRYDYVCKIDNAPVAYISVFVYGDSMDILSLYVHDNYRRKGLAENLVNYAINKHNNFNRLIVTLEVRVSNYSAILFYEKMGFEKISKREKYYNDLEDAFVMQLVKE